MSAQQQRRPDGGKLLRLSLDRDDRDALSRLASYALLFVLVLVGLLVLAVVAGFCVHLFIWAKGG
jgi:hypothetical protein